MATPHSPHTSILQNSCNSSSTIERSTSSENEQWVKTGSRQGTLSQSAAKVWAIIITVCPPSGCVLSYSLSQSSRGTREFGRNSPRGQDRPNIQDPHLSSLLSCFYWRDYKGRDTQVMLVVFIMLWSNLVSYLIYNDRKKTHHFTVDLLFKHSKQWLTFHSRCKMRFCDGEQSMGCVVFTLKLHKRAGSLSFFLFYSMRKTVFQASGNTKHLHTCTKPELCGSLHSNIPVWSLAGFLLRLLHAI